MEEGSLDQELVLTEISWLIASAAGSRRAIKPRYEAKLLLLRYPRLPMTEEQLVEEIVKQATKGRVSVDMNT